MNNNASPPSAEHAPAVQAETVEVVQATALVTPQVLAEVRVVPERPARRNPLALLLYFAAGAVVSLIGLFTLIVGLAVLATIPILQLASLGYLLEASGRIARTGRFRAGFVGLRPAGLAGLALVALFVVWLPLRLVAQMAVSASMIAPGSRVAAGWNLGVLIALGAVLAVALLAAFLVGLVRPRALARLRDAVWELLTRRLPYYFWLGLRGFVGGLIWLALPITMLVMASLLPNAAQGGVALLGALLRFFGSLLLMFAVLHVPYLQTRLAVENRFAAMFQLGTVRRHFRRAPLAFLLATTVLLLFALPLYLLKIELVPRDAAWLPSLLFVLFIFPARLLVGWAYGRALKRETRRHLLFDITARLALFPVAAFYTLMVFFTQFTGWYGVWGMYEQHAFLLPVPFLGM